MFRRQQTRRNYRKGQKRKRRLAFFYPFFLCFKIFMACSLLVATSGFFIFMHDVVTQSGYFTAKGVIIEGGQRLSQKQIAEQAQLRAGMNILAANLTVARKRLLSHPWIDEAEITREIPSGLIIRIKEHEPLAIVDLGHKFLINEKGEIFKDLLKDGLSCWRFLIFFHFFNDCQGVILKFEIGFLNDFFNSVSDFRQIYGFHLIPPGV